LALPQRDGNCRDRGGYVDPLKKPGLLASLERIVAQAITVTSIGSKAHSLANFQRGRRTGPKPWYAPFKRM
jgi:hypothetical protein